MLSHECCRLPNDNTAWCLTHRQNVKCCVEELHEIWSRSLGALKSLAKHARHEWEHHRPVQEGAVEVAEAFAKELEE